MNYKQYGFKKEGTQVYKLFTHIPIFPEVKTFKELAKELNLKSSTDVKAIVTKLPTLAPVFEDEDGKYISRIK